MVALADPLVEYIEKCGGKDVLHFQNDTAALAAARVLREHHPEVNVEARYEKVFLKLKGSK
jgi:hypothetical protein